MWDTIVHWALIAYLIIAPTVAVFAFRQPALAFALIVAGATALIFTRLPDISSLKLYGLQATLERQIGKVQVTIEQLQKLAAATAKANLTQLAMAGQMMHGLNTDAKFGIRDQIIASLKEIGVSDADTHDAQEIWISVYGDMLLSEIEGEANKLLPSAADEINKLPEAPKYGTPEPATLEKWIADHNLSSSRLDKLVADYKLLWTTGSMKDPSVIPFNRVMRMKDK
jgi:hypothetical protein